MSEPRSSKNQIVLDHQAFGRTVVVLEMGEEEGLLIGTWEASHIHNHPPYHMQKTFDQGS